MNTLSGISLINQREKYLKVRNEVVIVTIHPNHLLEENITIKHLHLKFTSLPVEKYSELIIYISAFVLINRFFEYSIYALDKVQT